jgi:misacylated tRNA(Ala) deacylase
MHATEELFRQDAYLRSCQAVVTRASEAGICLDRTVFYATGGGQPGDTGTLRTADGREIAIVACFKDPVDGAHLHVPAADTPELIQGEVVTAEIDWPRRYRLMRAHTCLHLLCALVPGAVTGGSVGEARGRLDFDAPQPLEKETIEAALNRLVQEDRPVTVAWISDAELAARPALVRTAEVSPPSANGPVRLIDIDRCDLQPCGGTHVRSTGEIGRVRVAKIEKKGRLNRRVTLVLDD